MPLTREQIYGRRRMMVFGSLALVLGTAFYLPMTLLAPLGQATAVVVEQQAPTAGPAALTWPAYGAGAVGAVGFPGALAQSGSTDPLPMASITKVVTALVVLQAKPLAVGEQGPSITMTAGDTALYRHYLSLNGKVASVRAGLTFTQYELMQLSLIDSANNYAASLAIWAYGSEAAFVTVAQAWVAAHELPGMTILDPTGIDPGDVAPVSTLIELGRLALADPVIAGLVGTKAAAIHDLGTITNTNVLLGTGGVIGIKTGTLDGSGSNLLFAADYPVGSSRVTLIGVVLGGPDHTKLNTDIAALLATVATGFHEVTVATPGERFAGYRSSWGQSADAAASTGATLITWADTPISTVVRAVPVGTADAGVTVGSVVFTAGSRSVTVPLELTEALSDPGPGWRLTHPGLIVGIP